MMLILPIVGYFVYKPDSMYIMFICVGYFVSRFFFDTLVIRD